MSLKYLQPALLQDPVTGNIAYQNPVTGKEVTIPDPSSVAITGGTIGAKVSLANAVSLMAYGAVGDGVADDTAAITAWVAALQKATASGTGAIGFVPPGTYKFLGVITIGACVIYGAGMHTSVFKASNASAQLLFNKTSGAYDESYGANQSLSDLTIDGAGVSTGSLVKFSVLNFPRWKSIAVINSAGVGLELSGTQNGLFDCCTITGNAGAGVLFSNDTGLSLGADGNMFLKCEISNYGTYAIDSSGKSFNNSFVECGIEYSTAASLAAVRLNNTDAATNSMYFRGGGFTNVLHAIPVFRLLNGTLNYEGGQAYGGGIAPSLFYLDGTGVLLKLDGNCMFGGATYLVFAHNAGGAFVYDLANYFNNCTNIFGTDVGAIQDSVMGRPMYSQLLLRRGQVRFPSTQIPSTDANTLDDYSEGTWTPVLAFGGASVGVTYVSQPATYVKIGRLVFVTGQIALSSKGSSVGAATITGLPFQSNALTDKTGIAAFGDYSGMSLTSSSSIAGRGFPSSTSIFLFQNSNTTNTALADTNFTNTSNLTFSMTYISGQ